MYCGLFFRSYFYRNKNEKRAVVKGVRSIDGRSLASTLTDADKRVENAATLVGKRR